MTTAGPEPGWYIDPEKEGQQRYWNGSGWTEHRTTGLPEPAPVPVRIVRHKRKPMPKPLFVALLALVVGALIWGFVAAQQSARQKIEDFDNLQRQQELHQKIFEQNLRDACMRNPSECGAG